LSPQLKEECPKNQTVREEWKEITELTTRKRVGGRGGEGWTLEILAT
jgi:hypothetical protein